MVPCGQVIEYQPVMPAPYVVPLPCQGAQCSPANPVYEPNPVIVTNPPVTELPVYELPVYEPPVYEPPIRVERPVVDAPVYSDCPEGTITGYGGQDCIPIVIPRK